jgi:predicted transcriptional regulator
VPYYVVMINIEEKPVNDPDKLLKLIQKGDAEMLLAEGDLGKGFNKLIQLDLISIEEGEVRITARGEEALEKGVDHLISQPVEAPEVLPVTTKSPVLKSQFQRKMWLLAVLLLLFAMILLASQLLN